jgi:hypothetical protein
MLGADFVRQPETAHDAFEPALERRVAAVVEVASSAGGCNCGAR